MTSILTRNENFKIITYDRLPSKYVLEFFNVVDIIGGTGQFENASGQFVNHGLVRTDGSGTDHTQEGTIILNK